MTVPRGQPSIVRGWEARSVANVIWSLLGVALVLSLLTAPRTVGEPLGVRRFLTPAVSKDWRIGQRFRMDADGLAAIEIWPEALNVAGGAYRLSLIERDIPTVVRYEDVTVSELVRGGSYVFRFPPIERSRNHDYEIRVEPAPQQGGEGLALWATKGAPSDGGGLLVNDAPRWASIAFRTQTTWVSPLRALLRPADTGRPPGWMALVALGATWLGMRYLLLAFIDSSMETVNQHRRLFTSRTLAGSEESPAATR